MNSIRTILALLALSVLCVNAPAQRALNGPPGGATPASLTVAYPQNLWPQVGGVATVYYVIDSASDPSATPNIDAAVKIFNADFSFIQWVPWNSTLGLNYVDINLSASDGSGQCEANEGYDAVPAQPMTGSTLCTIGTLLHEMGHVIGLWHEQSRPDRGTYVTVSYPNVIKGSWGNFQSNADDEQILAPYDYASVMHYLPYSFSATGLAVIETIPAGIPLAGYEGVPAQFVASDEPAVPVFDYSAGDKETIARLYGAAPKNITVTSNPVGLSVIVDGATVTTPQVFAWPLFSTHTLNVPSEVQTLPGYILNSKPPVAENFYYTYGRWNNSTSQSQSILVTPGAGTPAFPTTSPQIATYSANFIQLVPYTTAAIFPSESGTATISPQPLTYFGGTETFFVARQRATLTASANAGFGFYEFNNGPFWLPGGLGANPKIFNVPDSGNPVDPTAEFSNTPVYTFNVVPATFSSNLYMFIDGTFWYTPKNFSEMYDSELAPPWTTGSTHSVSMPALEDPYSFNTRYSFTSWSANVGAGGSFKLPANKATYTATVTPQYQPATNFGYPPCGGTATVSPASPTGDGFYPAGQVLSFSASPDSGPGWEFGGWTNDLTGTVSPKTLTANGETLVFANFNIAPEPLALTSVKPATIKAGTKSLVLTLTGTGFAAGSLVNANGQYRTVTFVNSTTLRVALAAADLANPGAFQIFVENFPSGWNGCAVFGYQTFLVGGKGAPAATPVFSPKPGKYSGMVNVSITDAIPGAMIFYTTDGSVPTTTSPQYSVPIVVSSTETLRADATAAGYLRSAVATAKYTITP
jgi:Astacin (Peptidase family M12A)/Chitobiase/beta-hexosaminidase C-terminal domain/Divergent InlB B-repeat domain